MYFAVILRVEVCARCTAFAVGGRTTEATAVEPHSGAVYVFPLGSVLRPTTLPRHINSKRRFNTSTQGWDPEAASDQRILAET